MFTDLVSSLDNPRPVLSDDVAAVHGHGHWYLQDKLHPRKSLAALHFPLRLRSWLVVNQCPAAHPGVLEWN